MRTVTSLLALLWRTFILRHGTTLVAVIVATKAVRQRRSLWLFASFRWWHGFLQQPNFVTESSTAISSSSRYIRYRKKYRYLLIIYYMCKKIPQHLLLSHIHTYKIIRYLYECTWTCCTGTCILMRVANGMHANRTGDVTDHAGVWVLERGALGERLVEAVEAAGRAAARHDVDPARGNRNSQLMSKYYNRQWLASLLIHLRCRYTEKCHTNRLGLASCESCEPGLECGVDTAVKLSLHVLYEDTL